MTIRGLEDEVFERFTRRAQELQRNAESHARFLIIQESEGGKLDTAGELIDDMWKRPAPKVAVKAIDEFQRTRGIGRRGL